MRKRMWIGVTILLVAVGGYLFTASPPGLLSKYDFVLGGSAGAEQVGEGIAFGDHGQTLDIWRSEEVSSAS